MTKNITNARQDTNARYFAALEKDSAFSRVSAYIILKDGKHAGTVKISFPRDGAGTLKAYIEDLTGEYPARRIGKASGYDKRSAALTGPLCGVEIKDNGWSWDRQLTDAGLTIIQAL